MPKFGKALNGKFSVMLRASVVNGYFTMSEVKKIGVARVSIGPRLQFVAAKAIQKGH
jgi:2-methylisocitrate lyase-like PEP mutase family enzyme